MKILVINDDGIKSAGLWAAVRAVRRVGEVVVVAPAKEQSGVGASLTLHSPVKVNPWTPDDEFQESDGDRHPVTAYTAEGTPGDCCILALETLTTGVDLVVSGINSGSNLGWDVMVSGTVGGAVQGYNRGHSTIAISVGSVTSPRYEVAGRLLEGLARRLSGREGGAVIPERQYSQRGAGSGEGDQGDAAGRPVLSRVGEAGRHRRRYQAVLDRAEPSWQPDPSGRLGHCDAEEQLRLHHPTEAGHGRRFSGCHCREPAGRADGLEQKTHGITLYEPAMVPTVISINWMGHWDTDRRRHDDDYHRGTSGTIGGGADWNEPAPGRHQHAHN